MTIYYQHVSVEGAARNFPRSLGTITDGLKQFHLSDIEVHLQHLKHEELQNMREYIGEFAPTGFQVWGFPSSNHVKKKNRMVAGDYLLFLVSGNFTYIGQVIHSISKSSEDLSQHFWHEPRFPIIVLLRGDFIEYPWDNFKQHFQYQKNFRCPGQLMSVSPQRIADSPSGSEEAFIEYLLTTIGTNSIDQETDESTPFPPKELTPQEIRKILESKKYHNLVGVVETDEVEFKGEPYQLDKDSQKQELSKDVTGLANSKGGVIVIGVKTEKHPSLPHEQAIEVSPFPIPPSAGDMEQQYRNILKDWIFPAIKIEVRLHLVEDSQSGTSPKFVLAIFIPEQRENQPFLINRYIDENEKRNEIVFGYVERHGPGVVPRTVSELHRLLNRGIFADEVINGKFEVIIDQLSKITAQEAEITKTNQTMNQHIEDTLTALNRRNRAAILLAVFPHGETTIPTLFQSPGSEIVQLLLNPPILRNLGFDLRVGSFPAIREGLVQRSVAPGWKILDLWKDGSIIFGAAGDGDFLCWGNANGTTLIINPLALIESTYLFIMLSREVFQKFSVPPPTKVTFMLSLQNPPEGDLQQGFTEKPYELLAGHWGNLHRAPESSIEFRLECLLENYNFYSDEESSGKIAFELLGKLYTWFGIEENFIPYSEDTEKGRRISRSMVIEGGSRPTFPPRIQ